MDIQKRPSSLVFFRMVRISTNGGSKPGQTSSVQDYSHHVNSFHDNGVIIILIINGHIGDGV